MTSFVGVFNETCGCIKLRSFTLLGSERIHEYILYNTHCVLSSNSSKKAKIEVGLARTRFDHHEANTLNMD